MFGELLGEFGLVGSEFLSADRLESQMGVGHDGVVLAIPVHESASRTVGRRMTGVGLLTDGFANSHFVDATDLKTAAEGRTPIIPHIINHALNLLRFICGRRYLRQLETVVIDRGLLQVIMALTVGHIDGESLRWLDRTGHLLKNPLRFALAPICLFLRWREEDIRLGDPLFLLYGRSSYALVVRLLVPLRALLDRHGQGILQLYPVGSISALVILVQSRATLDGGNPSVVVGSWARKVLIYVTERQLGNIRLQIIILVLACHPCPDAFGAVTHPFLDIFIFVSVVALQVPVDSARINLLLDIRQLSLLILHNLLQLVFLFLDQRVIELPHRLLLILFVYSFGELVFNFIYMVSCILNITTANILDGCASLVDFVSVSLPEGARFILDLK